MTQLNIKNIQVDEEIASSLGLNKTTICQNIGELTRVGSVLLDVSKKEISILAIVEEMDIDGDIYSYVFKDGEDILSQISSFNSGYVSSGKYRTSLIKISHLDYLTSKKFDDERLKQDAVKIINRLKDNVEEFKRKEKIKDKIKE